MLPEQGLSLSGKYVNIGNGSGLLFADAEEDVIGYDLHWDNTRLKIDFKYLSAERISPKSTFPNSDNRDFSKRVFCKNVLDA